MQDRHVTYHEIEASLVISSTSIHSILHEPGRKKLLFSLNHAIAQKRLVSIGEKNCWKNTIAVLQKLFMKKALQIVACFFGKTDHVTTVSLEQRTSVNSEWYTTMCLPEVFGEIRKRNKRRRINVHHGNVSSYISTQTSGERRIHGSSAVQSCLDTQWLLLIPAHQERNAWSTIFAKYHFLTKLIFSSNFKQHKWWSYVKTFWVRLC